LALVLWAPAALAAQTPAAHALRVDLARPLGWLGITIQDVSEELADRLAAQFGPAAGTGVVVVDAMPGSPAMAAGLRRGDVIVALDRQPVWDVHQLQERIRAAAVGQPVNVAVLRGRDRLQVRVSVAAMPDEAMAMVVGEALGFVVRPTREDALRSTGYRPQGEPELVVAAVEPRSSAAVAGFRPMDVLVEVDGRTVVGLKDLYTALRAAAAKPTFPVAVRRDGSRVVLRLSPPASAPSH
jgi:S1-C subfamily serine protease